MRTNAARLGPQVFVLVGPLASRIAASLSPQQSAVVNDSTTRILLEASADSTTQSSGQNLGPALSQQLAIGHFGDQQDDSLSARFAAPLYQDHRKQIQTYEHTQQQELSTSASLMNSLNTNTNQHNNQQDAQSLAATLARLGGWELVVVVALISLILISIVGNCLVCVAIFTDRRLRKLGNAFIVSLAIADLFVSCLVMTFALCNDLMDWWMFGERFCDIWISFDIMCCTASILNLCAISLDRFIHIKDCLLYNQLMTRRVALSAVLGIWLISALVSFVPINLGWHKPNHFKSSPPAPPALASNSSPTLMIPGSSLNETQALWLADAAAAASAIASKEPPNDNLMHGERLRRQATPSELDSSAISSENNGIRRDAPVSRKHFGHHTTQFAQLATQELQLAGEALWANKDFVSTERRRPPAGAGNRHQSLVWASSGLNTAATSSRASAQVDFRAGSGQGEGSRTNYYDSNQLASSSSSGMVGAKQSDDQVEFNPQDGSSGGHEQIKPQLRKKRLATESASRPPPAAQTESGSSGQRLGRATALLDHADERSPLGHIEEPPPPPPPPPGDHGTHSTFAGGGLHGSSAQRAPLEQRPEGEGRYGADDAAGHGHLPQCMLTLTPTYAIISSTISFYIPCLIMLGLYSKLFACARRHVRNIRAITRAPHPIASTTAVGFTSRAPSNGASATTQPNSRAPDTSATASGSSRTARSSQLNEALDKESHSLECRRQAPLASRARTWIKFAIRSSPNGSHGGECGTSERASGRQLAGSTQAQSVEPLAYRDNSTSAASGSGASSAAANDGRASCSPIAQRLSTTSGANEKPIDQAPAREDEPFLGAASQPTGDQRQHQRDNRQSEAISVANKNYCDNANDSLLTRSPSKASKSLANATGVKLNLEPNKFQQQQQQQHNQQQQAAAAASLASQLQQQQHKQQQTSQLATHKAAITLGIIMGTFLFCWVPFFCLNIIKAFYVDSIPGSMFRAFTWLGYANSALNPIIYGIHNSEFRNAFNRIFFKHLTLKNGRHYLNRRFSYDLRPHHHQARQHNAQNQQQRRRRNQHDDDEHPHDHHDDHQQHQSHRASNHNTSCGISGASVTGGNNHQLVRPIGGPHVCKDKLETSRAGEVKALVDHEREVAQTGFHMDHHNAHHHHFPEVCASQLLGDISCD